MDFNVSGVGKSAIWTKTEGKYTVYFRKQELILDGGVFDCGGWKSNI